MFSGYSELHIARASTESEHRCGAVDRPLRIGNIGKDVQIPLIGGAGALVQNRYDGSDRDVLGSIETNELLGSSQRSVPRIDRPLKVNRTRGRGRADIEFRCIRAESIEKGWPERRRPIGPLE